MEIKFFEDCFTVCDNNYTVLLDIVNFPKDVPLLQLNEEQRDKFFNIVANCHGLENYIAICKLFDNFRILNEDELDSWFDDTNRFKADEILNKFIPNTEFTKEQNDDFDDFLIGQGSYSVPHWFTDKDFEKAVLIYLVNKNYFPERD